MTFLADSSGRVILELYFRPDEHIANFKSQHPLTFHVAFVSENAVKDKNTVFLSKLNVLVIDRVYPDLP